MPSYYVFRKHLIPTSIDVSKVIMSLYYKYLKENHAVMTTFDMDRIIRKKWKRFESLREIEVTIRVPDSLHQLRAVRSESMDQYWLEKKPSDDNYEVFGRLSFKQQVCSICMEKERPKIELYHCKCLFHRKCIQQWAKYSDTCPVCSCTIYKRKVLNKSKCSENENDTKPLLEELV